MRQKERVKKTDIVEVNGLDILIDGNDEDTDIGNSQKIELKETPQETLSNGSKEGEWQVFLKYVDYYKDHHDQGIMVWINKDIKNALERIRQSIDGYSNRQILDAVCRSFIESSKAEIKKALHKNKDLLE